MEVGASSRELFRARRRQIRERGRREELCMDDRLVVDVANSKK